MKIIDRIIKGVIEMMEHDNNDVERYKAWSKKEEVLKKGMKDVDGADDIHILQELLNRFLDEELNIPLSVDGAFGKLTNNAVVFYQNFRFLEPSNVGKITRKDMYQAFLTKWSDNLPYMLDDKVMVYGTTMSPVGDIPHSYGEVSEFGGKTDCDDLMYGQAYLVKSDNRSPKVFCDANMDLVDAGILRRECLKLTEYPLVKCKNGKTYRASGSWCLDTEKGFYGAVFTKYSFGLLGMDNPRIAIKNLKNGKIAVILRTDKGPQSSCGVVDLSPAVMKGIDLKQDDKVVLGWADKNAKLGIY